MEARWPARRHSEVAVVMGQETRGVRFCFARQKAARRPALFLAGNASWRYRAEGGARRSVSPDFFIGARADVAFRACDPAGLRGGTRQLDCKTTRGCRILCLGTQPLHVVAAVDTEAHICHVITAYRPGLDRFEGGLPTKEEAMTGNSERCALCGGEKRTGTMTFAVDLKFGVVVVRDVPHLFARHTATRGSTISSPRSCKPSSPTPGASRRSSRCRTGRWRRRKVGRGEFNTERLPAMNGDGRVDQVAAQATQARERPLLVSAGEPAVADDVRDQDRLELAHLAHCVSPLAQRNTIV